MRYDRIDARILEIVQKNNRLTSEAIGELIGLSATACQRRLKRLRSEGIIAADVSLVSANAVGRAIQMLVLVTLEREREDTIDRFKSAINSSDELVNGYYVTGDSDFVVKKAAALANARLGDIPTTKATAIAAACDDIIAGGSMTEFPVDVFQGGAGTSTNMNMNEVIANRAFERLGFSRGRYDIIHPNDHVNRLQSTNDVYPTAIRLAVILTHQRLDRELRRLGLEFTSIVKLGRTLLQDAVPMTLGQEFSAFAATMREDVGRLEELVALFREVNLGDTAIGTGSNTKP